MMGTQACCLCGQRTSMSGASDPAECNSAGRTDSKSVFLANPRFICSPSPTRLTINEYYHRGKNEVESRIRTRRTSPRVE